MSAPSPEVEDFSRQDIRIAAVLTGGVSLAIWISGVTVELAHLALSSQGVDCWPEYRQILDLLRARARVDVIAGTSAGGLNGAFLALGLAHQRDLMLLRDLWTESGSLEHLLRPTNDKTPPSLLQGDGYFLPTVRDALARTVDDEKNPALGSGSPEPVELILTGTLWTGRQTAFTDDMGVGLTQLDYDATFRFSREESNGQWGNLDDGASVVPQLAAAGRCTSSFPGAFEPHAVEVSGPSDQPLRWQSSAGNANFDTTQYVVDGGVLLNNPVRPALDAIYRQPGEHQIRRVLAYVNPDPGEPGAGLPGTLGPVPTANQVLLDVLTRLKSTESVSRQLSEIRERNASVRLRRRARARLAKAMTAEDLSGALWDGYREERVSSACTTISGLVAAGQNPGPQVWSERELAEALARHARTQVFPFVPEGDLDAAVVRTGTAWDWGQTTVSRLADMTVDVMKRAVWLAPVDSVQQQGVVGARASIAELLGEIRADRRALDAYWTRLGSPAGALPAREGPSTQAANNLGDLDAWVAGAITSFEATDPLGHGPGLGPWRDRQYGQALALAAALSDHRDGIARIARDGNALVDPGAGQQEELLGLQQWLYAGDVSAASVLTHMLRLDVVHFATAGALDQVEQEVELVQISCADPAAITGMQVHHFGAFYRAPWRVNDWIRGRLDGTRQVMRILLAPERLRQQWGTTEDLLAALRTVAVADVTYRPFLEARWSAHEASYAAEAAAALSPTAANAALDEIADAVSLPLQLRALATDLPALAAAIRAEKAVGDAPPGSAAWLGAYDAMVDGGPGGGASLSGEQLCDLRDRLGLIGKQTIAEDVGSDTFARTMAKTGVAAAGLVGSPPRLADVKAVRFTLSAIRGYTALVWALVSFLTRHSGFGARLVEIVVAVGGVMLAVTLLVPGIPLVFTLAGVLLLLGGVTAAALLTPPGGWLGLRALAATLVVAVALVALVWNGGDWNKSAVLATLAKALVGVLVIVLGAFVARVKPSRTEIVTTAVIVVLALGGLIAALVA